MLGVSRQQYLGRAFVGNHVHKSLQETILTQIQISTLYTGTHQLQISSIEALRGSMVATAQREIPSILSDVMATATIFRNILAQFGRSKSSLKIGTFAFNSHSHTELYGKFQESISKSHYSHQDAPPGRPYMHTLQWANRMHVGFGLLGEQGRHP